MLTAVRGICLLSAGIFILRMLSDGTKLGSQAEFVFKLIFMLVTVTSLTKGIKSIELPDISRYESYVNIEASDIYREELERQTAENIADVLMSQLTAAGIEAEKLKAEVNISDDGSISINRVIIRTADPADAEELIRRSLGQETEVVNETD